MGRWGIRDPLHHAEGLNMNAKIYTARMTTRGRVTLPKEILQALEAKPGDWIEFVFDGYECRLINRGLAIKHR